MVKKDIRFSATAPTTGEIVEFHATVGERHLDGSQRITYYEVGNNVQIDAGAVTSRDTDATLRQRVLLTSNRQREHKLR
jgi:hypothetical protein